MGVALFYSVILELFFFFKLKKLLLSRKLSVKQKKLRQQYCNANYWLGLL